MAIWTLETHFSEILIEIQTLFQESTFENIVC